MNVEIAADPETESENYFPVLMENAFALMLFLQLETQWRTAVDQGQIIWWGLDYTPVIEFLKLKAKKKKRAELFDMLREMENAALPVLNGGKCRKEDEP